MNYSALSDVQFQSYSDTPIVITGPYGDGFEEQLYLIKKGLKDRGAGNPGRCLEPTNNLFSRLKDSSTEI